MIYLLQYLVVFFACIGVLSIAIHVTEWIWPKKEKSVNEIHHREFGFGDYAVKYHYPYTAFFSLEDATPVGAVLDEIKRVVINDTEFALVRKTDDPKKTAQPSWISGAEKFYSPIEGYQPKGDTKKPTETPDVGTTAVKLACHPIKDVTRIWVEGKEYVPVDTILVCYTTIDGVEHRDVVPCTEAQKQLIKEGHGLCSFEFSTGKIKNEPAVRKVNGRNTPKPKDVSRPKGVAVPRADKYGRQR